MKLPGSPTWIDRVPIPSHLAGDDLHRFTHFRAMVGHEIQIRLQLDQQYIDIDRLAGPGDDQCRIAGQQSHAAAHHFSGIRLTPLWRALLLHAIPIGRLAIYSKPNAATSSKLASIRRMRFPEYFDNALTKAGISQRAFSKKVKYGQSNMNKIVRGKKPPPLARIEAWADALSGHIQRDVFLELARLECSPPEIRDLVIRLRHQLGRDLKTK